MIYGNSEASSTTNTEHAASARGSKTSAKPDADSRRMQFEELVVPIMQPLYRRALRLVRDASAADDIVQETIYRAWKNFDRFQTGTRFRQWVFQIMTYHFFSELREVRRRRRLYNTIQANTPKKNSINDGWAENPLSRWDSHSYTLCDDEVKHAMEQLPNDQRSLLLLVALGDHSYHDAAEHFKVPAGTIMSRLHRARQKLKEELEAQPA